MVKKTEKTEKTLAIFLGIVLFPYIALATFVFAGLAYDRGDQWEAIIATGVLAATLLALQTVIVNPFRPPPARKPRITGKTVVVGVAIHYSAMIIGVSFGDVFSAGSGNLANIIAVLIKQAVLTYAAWILVNRFR